MTFLEALYVNPFLQSALIAGLLVSVVSGVMGSYVVIKRIAFISGSIAHAVLGGIGLSLYLDKVQGWNWLSPLGGALVAAIVSAWVIGAVHLHYRQREDSVIAAIWSIGMASGILFTSQIPGFNTELTNYLIGNILWVSRSDLILLAGLDALVLGAVVIWHKQFLTVCFDEVEAKMQGLAVNRLYLLLLTLIAVSIVLLIQVMGIVLVITMLTLPATIANLFVRRLPVMMGVAVVISSIFSVSGIFFSYQLELPPGATIAVLAGVTYLIILLGKRRVVA